MDTGEKGHSTFVSELGWSEANNPQNFAFPVRSLITGKAEAGFF
jgi:hypothetical protein